MTLRLANDVGSSNSIKEQDMKKQFIKSNVKKLGAVAALATVVAGTGMGIAGAATPAQGPSGNTGSHVGHAGERQHPAPGGTVTAISANSITVQGRSGESKTFSIDAGTVFLKAGVKVSASDITVGSQIRIMPTAKGSTAASKIFADGPHVAGKVTAVNGSTVSLTNRDGSSFTVVESASTTYAQNGATASSSDVAVGQRILAEGSFESGSTTTLDATNVIIGLPGPGHMGAGPMDHGQMGHGPLGDNGGNPAPAAN